MTARNLTRIAFITLLVFLAFAYTSGAQAASGQAGQCDGYNDPANTKIDTSDDDLVLPAGLTVCIHASNENTGQFTTDGVLTLGEYIIEFGLKNNGGQTPGVSNYVIYGTGNATPPPSENPSVAPSENPTDAPTEAPTTEPTPEVTDCVGCGRPGNPGPTPPETSTASNAGPTGPARDGLLLIAALLVLTVSSIVLAPARRNIR